MEEWNFGASSSPSRQSICLSPRLWSCTHTPVLQRKLPFLQSGAQTENTLWERRLWNCTKPIYKCVFDLLLQHISSLRSPQSSIPSQVWLIDTHLVFTHLKPHSSSETPEDTRFKMKHKTQQTAWQNKLGVGFVHQNLKFQNSMFVTTSCVLLSQHHSAQQAMWSSERNSFPYWLHLLSKGKIW